MKKVTSKLGLNKNTVSQLNSKNVLGGGTFFQCDPNYNSKVVCYADYTKLKGCDNTTVTDPKVDCGHTMETACQSWDGYCETAGCQTAWKMC